MSINKPLSVSLTENNILIVFEGHAPYTLRKNQHDEEKAKRFEKIKAKIISACENEHSANWEEVRALFVPKLTVEEVLSDAESNSFSKGGLVLKEGKFYYKGFQLKNYLVKRILELKLEADRSGQKINHVIKPLLKFLDNLMKNPSSNAVAQLYRFVEHTKMPVSEDGCLLAYKIITKDYKDKFTRKNDNSIGAVVSMPRNEVVDDPDKTCAAGLHFCSYNYATGFFNNRSDNRMVVIKVNPEDVVSIPTDYNNEKGRCCKYQVLYEIPMEEVLGRDVLDINSDEDEDYEQDFEFDEDDFSEFDTEFCHDCGQELDDGQCPDCDL